MYNFVVVIICSIWVVCKCITNICALFVIFVFSLHFQPITQYGQAGTGAPPAERTRSKQSWIWPPVAAFRRSLPHLHPLVHIFWSEWGAAAEGATGAVHPARALPPVSSRHGQKNCPVSHAWECESGGHVWGLWHRRDELSGVKPAHSYRGSERGADKESRCSCPDVRFMNTCHVLTCVFFDWIEDYFN